MSDFLGFNNGNENDDEKSSSQDSGSREEARCQEHRVVGGENCRAG
jgi:hypothetical protein